MNVRIDAWAGSFVCAERGGAVGRDATSSPDSWCRCAVPA